MDAQNMVQVVCIDIMGVGATYVEKPTNNMLVTTQLEKQLKRWDVVKRPKTPDFDSGIRRFESCHPYQRMS